MESVDTLLSFLREWYNTYMKKLVHSKTFWFAVSQAVGAVLIVAFTELDMMGGVLVVKSIMDIALRLETKEPIQGIY